MSFSDFLDVAAHVVLHGVECNAAEHVEELSESLCCFQEFGGVDGIVLGLVDGDIVEGLLAVEVGAARWVCHDDESK